MSKTVITVLLFALTIAMLTSCGGGSARRTTNADVDTTVDSIVMQKPVINVYIENSGSMDGYVKGVTEFEQAIYSYLSDIKIARISDSLNLYYINSKVLPQNNDIQDFISKLEPSSFRAKGGNRAASDMSDVLSMVMNSTKENTISILISDCVFSLSKGVNADEYLINQQIGVKVGVSETFRDRDFATIVYQLNSQFEGRYYNKFNRPTTISGQRPYYIWILGDEYYLKELISTVKYESVRGSGVKNVYTGFKMHDTPNYAILSSPKLGRFERDRQNSQKHIRKIEMDKRGDNPRFMFSIGVDYSDLILDDSYLMDPQNYRINDSDYSLEITKSNNSSYTHIIKLTTPIIKSSMLKIELLNNKPTWVDLLNDDQGEDINAEGAMGKTYGIKYLIGGVHDAFTNEDNVYTVFNVSVN